MKSLRSAGHPGTANAILTYSFTLHHLHILSAFSLLSLQFIAGVLAQVQRCIDSYSISASWLLQLFLNLRRNTHVIEFYFRRGFGGRLTAIATGAAELVPKSKVTSTTMIQRLNMKSQSSWNRTASISAVARIVGALAVCISMGFFPQVRGQTNYTVGSGFVNGSLWTNTIDGLVEAGILENAYKQWADSVLIKEGDTLIFNYERAMHTVFIVKSADDYINCIRTSALQVTDGTPTAYTVKSTDAPTLYVFCNIVGHCEAGQKVAITIANTSSPPTPSPSPNSSAAGSTLLGLQTCMISILAATLSYLT